MTGADFTKIGSFRPLLNLARRVLMGLCEWQCTPTLPRLLPVQEHGEQPAERWFRAEIDRFRPRSRS